MCENPTPRKLNDHDAVAAANGRARQRRADTERVRLVGWYREISSTVKALLFGELLERAKDIVEAYPSDLWHDALWIDKFVTGPMTFYFTARTFGTFIGTEPMFGSDTFSEHYANYVVELTCTEGLWEVEFTSIPADSEAVCEFVQRFDVVARERAESS